MTFSSCFACLWSMVLLAAAGCDGGGDAGPSGSAGAQVSANKAVRRPVTPGGFHTATEAPSEGKAATLPELPLPDGKVGMAARMDLDMEAILSDRARFASLAEVPVGDSVVIPTDGDLDAQSWRSMGFLPLDLADADPQDSASPTRGQTYRREVDLLGTIAMQPSHMPDLPQVDCVALISIDRRNGETPYVYTTLRSIFARFPSQVVVNILVGNEDTEYVSPSVLAAHIGEDLVPRVHVFPTSPQISNYLRAHLPPNRRGGWNYTRALRSYQGTTGLVLMEDDVIWAEGGLPAFDTWVTAHPVPALSFYTIYFDRLDALKDQDSQALLEKGRLFFVEQSTHRRDFTCLQGMYYASQITADLGRYTLMRQHHLVYDAVIGWFFAHHKMIIGYPFPSMVQHIGTQSSCDSGATHMSYFFREKLVTD